MLVGVLTSFSAFPVIPFDVRQRVLANVRYGLEFLITVDDAETVLDQVQVGLVMMLTPSPWIPCRSVVFFNSGVRLVRALGHHYDGISTNVESVYAASP